MKIIIWDNGILKTLKDWSRVLLGVFLLVVLVLSMVNALQPKQEIVKKELKSDVQVFSSGVTDRQIRWCKKNKSCSVLAEAGYYEARNQDDIGVVAVMRVIMNRAEHSKWPDTVHEVVYHRCQFSYVCDGSLNKKPIEKDQWERMYTIAYEVFAKGRGSVFNNFTHYHTTAVNPHWAKHYETVALLGDHIFYKCQKMC